MKTDARVRYTVHMIQNVFLELLKEKPVAKITVKEICEHAEINRSTFYKHYQDVYDLMEKLENEAVEAFEKLLDSYVQNETVPALVTLLTSLRENRELLLPLLANSSNDDFMKRVPDMRYLTSHRRRTIRVIQNRRPSMLILQEEHQESSAIGWKPVHRSLRSRLPN